MSITPDTMLEVGTKVRVKDNLGTVVKVEWVPAQPSGMIAVHHIRFTHKKIKVRNANSAEISWFDKPIPVTTTTVNYSFIEVL